MDVSDQDFRIMAECLMKCQLEETKDLPADLFSAFYNEIALNMDIPLVEIVSTLLKFNFINEHMSGNKSDDKDYDSQRLEFIQKLFELFEDEDD